MKSFFSLNKEELKINAIEIFFWIFIFFVQSCVLFTFVSRGDVSFGSDEANQFAYAHKWGDPELIKDCCRNLNYLGGIRLWTAHAMDRLTDGWIYAGRLNSVFIALLAVYVWIFVVYRRISKWAAIFMAMAMAIPPVCASYYLTVYDGRMLILIFGGLLVFFAGQWLESWFSMAVFGFLIGRGWPEEIFIVFFATSVLFYEIWIRRQTKIKKPWGKGAALILGFLAEFSYCFFQDLQHPSYIPHYFHWGLANWEGIKQHLLLLWEAFPQFWNGNMPYGYLQNSMLGLRVDPMDGFPYSLFLRIWTGMTFGFSIWGFHQLDRSDPKKRDFVILAVGPAALFILFFIFGNQVWDALSFRYLSFWIIFIPMGFGIAIYLLFQKKRSITIAVLMVWLAGYGFILTHRIERLPGIFPSKVIEKELDKIGVTAGYANYWTSEVIRYLSGNRLAIVPYNVPSFSCAAYERAHNEKRIGLIVLEGLDRPLEATRAKMEIIKSGYVPTRKWNFDGNWFILEFERKSLTGKD